MLISLSHESFSSGSSVIGYFLTISGYFLTISGYFLTISGYLFTISGDFCGFLFLIIVLGVILVAFYLIDNRAGGHFGGILCFLIYIYIYMYVCLFCLSDLRICFRCCRPSQTVDGQRDATYQVKPW